MEILTRIIESRLKSLIGKNKVLLILGTRRVGKTVLINKIVKEYNKQVVLLNGEDLDTQEILQQRTATNYKRIAGDAQLLVIDEAQAIPRMLGGRFRPKVNRIRRARISSLAQRIPRHLSTEALPRQTLRPSGKRVRFAKGRSSR